MKAFRFERYCQYAIWLVLTLLLACSFMTD
jgi:hypothetical protein